MWLPLFLSLAFGTTQQQPPPERAASHDQRTEAVIQEVSASGRCADVAESPDSRVAPQPAVAPGPPPLLSFRYYEGKLHHRFGNSELMLDDAGH
ncbi:MAG: hypothetical protein JO033_24600 [Acidobacteriaceae bacterium]|nr:hypothetical protein [Acidobacteriaceae bacterium]